MSEDSKKYRAEMRTKAYKLANQKDERVDASDWRREGFDATEKKPVDIKEGPLAKCGKGPSNPRSFKNGGVVARANGGRTARKARAMGGPNMAPTGQALGNSVVPPTMVPQRGMVQQGTVGLPGLKRGGKVGSGIHIKASHKGLLHKELGVPEGKGIPARKLEKAANSSDPAERKRAVFAENAKKWNHKANGGAAFPKALVPNSENTDWVKHPQGGYSLATPKEQENTKWTSNPKGGYDLTLNKKARKSGGEVVGTTEVTGTRPTGGRLARASGGKAGKGKMNVNIIIAQKPDSAMGNGQPPAPMPPRPAMAPPPGAQIGGPGMPPGAPPMPPGGGNMPPPSMMRKRGGKVEGYPIEDGAGGGEGRLEKIKAYG